MSRSILFDTETTVPDCVTLFPFESVSCTTGCGENGSRLDAVNTAACVTTSEVAGDVGVTPFDAVHPC